MPYEGPSMAARPASFGSLSLMELEKILKENRRVGPAFFFRLEGGAAAAKNELEKIFKLKPWN